MIPSALLKMSESVAFKRGNSLRAEAESALYCSSTSISSPGMTFNFEPMLAGELYGPLKSVSLFNQVSIDPEVHTLVWPNGADFDPAVLHDWPQYAEAFVTRAQQWAGTAA